MMKWDPFVRVRGEGGIHVTSPERGQLRAMEKEGWDVNLFIRFAVFCFPLSIECLSNE